MALDTQFKLAKLTITAYKAAARSERDKIGAPIEVQYNPETLSFKHENAFQDDDGVPSERQARFARGRSRELNVRLVFDGTNVGYFGIELLRHVPTVAERVKAFLQACYWVKSDIHEPPYLKLMWDKGVLGRGFDCRLGSVNITYTAFDRDGSPLRADLDAVFTEDLDPAKKLADERLSSPDVSHRRVVKSGDTLPLLCCEIYGSARHYLRVAAVNELDDFRVLTPGQELVFPPFERRGGS